MSKTVLVILTMALVPFGALAVDGVVLINQSAVMAAGGFPYHITQPGGYRLSGNLTVPLGVNGIEITADGVTIDLNGFSIVGPGTFPNSGAAVFATDHQRISLSNGTVSGFVSILSFVGSSRAIVLDSLLLDGVTRLPDGTIIGGGVLVVGRDRSAGAIIRNVTLLTGQIQITCPSLVTNSVVFSIVETNVPFTGIGVSFPTNCKGENVVTGNF